jgi:hypothetical protein
MIRTLIDEIRSEFVADSSISPTRSITYKREADDVEVTLNSFVGNGNFNKVERDAIGSYQAFGGLALLVAPKVNDTVLYDGVSWKVVRFTKLGNLYTVYGEIVRTNGRPTR